MMMSEMERSTFNTKYNYRLVEVLPGYKHCGNCRHLKGIRGDTGRGVVECAGCVLMAQCQIPLREINVNNRRGLCDLWQKENQ